MVLLMTIATTQSLHAAQLLYLASQVDKTIVALSVNDTTGALTKTFSVDLPGNPGPLAFSPDATFMYAAVTGLDDDKAGISTLARAADGSLTLRHTAEITSRTPYIRISNDGRFLLAAHYSAGDITVHRMVDGICTGELLDHHVTEKTAHCIELDPTGRFAFVPHTTPNNVYQFRLDARTGKLIPNDPPFVDGPEKDHRYHEPRHYMHHPKLNMAYTSNEYGGGITAWKFDPERGILTRLQTLSTLPPDVDGKSYAADLRITPDGRFAYVSNRDATERADTDAHRDTLTGIALDAQTGKMSVIGYFPTAHIPRSFCIDTTGRFVYAAGQESANLYAYQLDQQSGILEHTATYETGEVPVWVMCGTIEN